MNTEEVFWVTLRGKRFCFYTQSKKNLDTGSELLIEHMDITPTDIVLDFLCGFGAKGIVAASIATQGHVHMVDVDPIAVEYVGKNAEINYVKKRVEAYASDGILGIEKGRTFHKILFVLSEGTKKDVFARIVTEIKPFLKPGGKFYVTTSTRLKHVVKDLLEKEFGNYEKVASKEGFLLSVAEK